jgi:hypothetical protein
MESRSFPEISCTLCGKPLDLETDLCADEKGKAIHEECYVKRLFAASKGHRGPYLSHSDWARRAS